MTNVPNSESRHPLDEPPPFLRTWPRVYAGVLCYVAVLIALLYIITRLFTY